MSSAKITAAVALTLSNLVAAAEEPTGFLCVSEAATGFGYNAATKSWQVTKFKATANYLLTRSSRTGAKWEVKEVGSRSPSMFCQADLSQEQLLSCQGFGAEFRFNGKLLRFMYTYTVGYWNEDTALAIAPGRKEGDDTPALVIGKCSPL